MSWGRTSCCIKCMCIGCSCLAWPLQQQTFMTLGVILVTLVCRIPWWAERKNLLGEAHRQVAGFFQGSCPAIRDKRLWGYAGAFPPVAGGAETPPPPLLSWPASDVGAVLEALVAFEETANDLQWLCCEPLLGSPHGECWLYHHSPWDTLLIGGKWS